MSFLPGLEPAAPPTDDHDGDGDEWYTPPEVLRALRSLTHDGRIDLDPCHAPRSLTDPRHRIDVREGGDGVTDVWPGDGLAFCNPPYSDVGPWLARCQHEAKRRPVVMLIPMRPETGAWWSHVWGGGGFVVVQRGRIRFVGPTGERHGNGMITTCFVAWSEALASSLAEALTREGIDAVAVGRLPVLPW